MSYIHLLWRMMLGLLLRSFAIFRNSKKLRVSKQEALCDYKQRTMPIVPQQWLDLVSETPLCWVESSDVKDKISQYFQCDDIAKTVTDPEIVTYPSSTNIGSDQLVSLNYPKKETLNKGDDCCSHKDFSKYIRADQTENAERGVKEIQKKDHLEKETTRSKEISSPQIGKKHLKPLSSTKSKKKISQLWGLFTKVSDRKNDEFKCENFPLNNERDFSCRTDMNNLNKAAINNIVYENHYSHSVYQRQRPGKHKLDSLSNRLNESHTSSPPLDDEHPTMSHAQIFGSTETITELWPDMPDNSFVSEKIEKPCNLQDNLDTRLIREQEGYKWNVLRLY
jgi:hypothetical protein